MTDDARTPGPDDRPQYHAAREAFEKLDARDKAAFLLESAFGAAGEVVAEAARSVADVMDRAGSAEFWNRAHCDPDPADPADPGTPEPPRPKRRPPSPGAADAGSPGPDDGPAPGTPGSTAGI